MKKGKNTTFMMVAANKVDMLSIFIGYDRGKN
jgi:hypothetical protein